jgi:hypothetical protein
MSQHRYTTTAADGRQLRVLLGYDRPLGGFFFVVEDRAKPPGKEAVYSNLDDPQLSLWYGLPPYLEHFQDVAKALGVALPLDILRAVLADGANRVGNKAVDYGERNA